MNSGHVLIQMSLVSKAVPTVVDLASVWLVARVLIHVGFESTFLCEGLWTKMALKRFWLSGVGPHVDLKSLPLVI